VMDVSSRLPGDPLFAATSRPPADAVPGVLQAWHDHRFGQLFVGFLEMFGEQFDPLVDRIVFSPLGCVPLSPQRL